VPVSSGTEYNYKWGLDRFLQEARVLAKFSHPNIVTVGRYFEANGTAYMVMNYESGVSLSQMLRRIAAPDEELLLRIILPLLDGLHAVHMAGFLHRDIKPSNIFIRDTGVPVLLDFGAARLAIGSSTHTITSILTPGYAPLEQYSKEGNQGEWTDIYSLAAVCYRAVIGDNPPDVVTRLRDDPVIKTLIEQRTRFTTGFLHAINRGLEVDEKKRPQSVPEWKAMFTGEAYVAPPPSPLAFAVASTKGRTEEPATLRARQSMLQSGQKPSPVWMTQLTWMASGALVLFLAIGGYQMYDRLSGNEATRALNAGQADKPVKLTPREFYVLDRDRSGYLTRDEVKGDAVLEQNFTKIDKNRDGRVSLEEFTSFP
jgi:serine/threonine protein kinase